MLNKKALAAAVGVPAQYQIERSLRFNSADSPYLTRTPASAGNRKTWTFSFWYKKAKTGASGNDSIMGVSTGGSTYATMRFGDVSNDVFGFDGDAGAFNIRTVGVFRDVSAWYHFVVSVDTTQATSSNRIKIYVNNVQQTTTGTQPSQNYESLINSANQHDIGNLGSFYNNFYINGYLTEVNFIDGQALTPSSFGETDADTGIWKPKAFSGTYGTNGFYLDFSDNSGTTSTTLGKDYSGNSNNWTPNNFSVTAGTGNDSLVDTPTPYGTDTGAGGEVRGNYCTLNPLSNGAGSLSNGNLQLNGTTTSAVRCNSTMAVASGKWYFETTLTTAESFTAIGIGQGFTTNQYPGKDALSYAFTLEGAYIKNNDADTSYGSSLTSGDVFMCAFDLDNNKVFFGKNGTWFGSSNPATGSNPAYSITAGTYTVIARAYSTSAVTHFNFGQRPFAYTAPSGFKALCTTNLPTPTIGATATTRADDYFNTVLYTGTGSQQAITGVGFQPDLLWIKVRSTSAGHGVVDAVRGRTKVIYTNATTAEDTSPANSDVASFDSNGFTVDPNYLINLNSNGATYVAWCWKANGAGSSNTAGSITSTVSANTTAGISVVTYTAPATNTFTVGHGLGVAPSMILVKGRNQAYNWDVYHASLGATGRLILNTTSDFVTTSGPWANTSPTSSVFSSSGNGVYYNSGDTLVAYCFAPVAGFSAFGSYTGNGSSDGPFIYTGFRPAFIIVKQTNTGGENWYLMDNKRSTFNLVNDTLYPNQSSAETVDNANVTCDFTSNGFKIRDSYTGWNANGGTYIYACFAENPFKYSLAR